MLSRLRLVAVLLVLASDKFLQQGFLVRRIAHHAQRLHTDTDHTDRQFGFHVPG